MTHKKTKLRHNHLSQKQNKRPKINKKELARTLAGAVVLLSACSNKTDDCGKNYPEELCDPNKETAKIVDNEDGTQTVKGIEDTGAFSGKIEISYGDIAGIVVLLAVAALANKNLWRYIKKGKKPKNN